MMDSQRSIEVAVAIVRQGGTVLIGRRPESKILAGYWEFPGGKMGPGESPRDAAVRECLEETGIAIRVSGTSAVVEHGYDHGTLRLHFLDAVPVDPVSTPRLPFRWVPVSELETYRFPPANATILEALKTER